MPRPLRSIRQNVTYHVVSRCIECRTLMGEEHFRELFLEVVALAKEKYTFELNQYEIMDNHFHLIIHTLPGEASIDRIMQYIKSRFAEKYNRQNERIGPFWNERYSCKIIQDSKKPVRYLLWLLWYLAYNPVRKEFVDDPRDYRYGGINAYLGNAHRLPLGVTLHKYFRELGDTFTDCVKVLLEYEKQYFEKLKEKSETEHLLKGSTMYPESVQQS